MTKEQFLEKHKLSELDWRNLIRYEEARKTGIMNMFDYLNLMQEFNINGGKRLARWILTSDNYFDFLETLKEKRKEMLE